MSKSISDIFKRNNEVVKLPSNTGENFDSETRTGSWVSSGIGAYKEDVTGRAWKILGDTLSKYEQFRNNPGAVLQLINGVVPRPVSETNEVTYSKRSTAENIGRNIAGKLGIWESGSGAVPIPPYMSQEDGALVQWAAKTIIGAASTALGGRVRPNYELIFRSRTNSGLLNKSIDALTGDYLKKEFEKGRYPFKLPNSMDNDKAANIYSNYDESGPTSIWGAVKKAVTTYLAGDNTGNNARDIIYNKQMVNLNVKRLESQYLMVNDPYDGQFSIGASTFSEAIEALKGGGYLAGYQDYAGFEIGSNHQWKIEIYPYPHEYDDIENYSTLGRKSCTPPLPVYFLPNLWKEKDSIESCLPKSTGLSGQLLNDLTNDVCKDIVKQVVPIMDDVTSPDVAAEIAKNNVMFSFSRNTPVLSYDLNFGTIKTESLKLFNGNSVEIFAGMNYNATMNMSILDDIYCSMYKYMMLYINSVYDIKTHSMAPYYNCAFQINLKIFRSGGQVNHSFKFIGIPIEFTPRFDGQQEPNEARVDITFGIIGFIPQPSGGKFLYPDNMGGRSGVDSKDTKQLDLGSLTWDDIQVKMS